MMVTQGAVVNVMAGYIAARKKAGLVRARLEVLAT
jgi:hypothetical protein